MTKQHIHTLQLPIRNCFVKRGPVVVGHPPPLPLSSHLDLTCAVVVRVLPPPVAVLLPSLLEVESSGCDGH